MSRQQGLRARLVKLRRTLRRWRREKYDWFDAFVSHIDMIGPRSRFIVVVGFHHSGTTLVQSVLRDQGVYTPDHRGIPPDRQNLR